MARKTRFELVLDPEDSKMLDRLSKRFKLNKTDTIRMLIRFGEKAGIDIKLAS